MRAISLWQPWAQLIVDRRKIHETRSWPVPPALLGTDVALHASKKWDGELATIAKEFGYFADRRAQPDETMPVGCIVGVMRLASIVRTEHLPDPYDAAYGDFTPGRWAWRLEDVRKFRTPIPCVGHQGFFGLSPAVEQAVQDALAGRTRNPRDGDRLSESELAQLMRSPR